MAFTFTVEDGTPIADSNSYVAVADADDYYEIDQNFAATWTAYTTGQKEERLAWSSRILDQKCLFEGYRVASTQSMRWPRYGVCDKDGEAISRTTIPWQLQEAVLEHLKYSVTNDATTGSDVDYLSKVVVDVIELEYQEDTAQTNVPNILNNILDPIGKYIVGGRGSGKIRKA